MESFHGKTKDLMSRQVAKVPSRWLFSLVGFQSVMLVWLRLSDLGCLSGSHLDSCHTVLHKAGYHGEQGQVWLLLTSSQLLSEWGVGSFNSPYTGLSPKSFSPNLCLDELNEIKEKSFLILLISNHRTCINSRMALGDISYLKSWTTLPTVTRGNSRRSSSLIMSGEALTKKN